MRDLETLIVAAIFAACHFLSPRVFRLQERVRAEASSFSGGLAAAYVFLHLLPEIAEEGELLGPRIYFVVLVGLAAYYGLEIFIHRSQAKGRTLGADATLHFATSALYSAMMVFTLGEQLPATMAATVAFALTMGLHLTSSDLGLQEAYGELYVRRGRFVLVAAVAAGYGLTFIREPHEEVIDVLTALLAGLVIFTVFHKELPEFRKARFRPFLLGMAIFLLLHVVLEGDL